MTRTDYDIPEQDMQIIQRISDRSGVSVQDLLSDSRAADVTYARNEVYYHLTENERRTTVEVGRMLGRCHSTVVTGRRRYAKIVLKHDAKEQAREQQQTEARRAAGRVKAVKSQRKSERQRKTSLMHALSDQACTDLRREILESVVLGEGSMRPMLKRGYTNSDSILLGQMLCPELQARTTSKRVTVAREVLRKDDERLGRTRPEPLRRGVRPAKPLSPPPEGCTRVKGWKDGKPVHCGAKTKYQRCAPCEAELNYAYMKPAEALRIIKVLRNPRKAVR